MTAARLRITGLNVIRDRATFDRVPLGIGTPTMSTWERDVSQASWAFAFRGLGGLINNRPTFTFPPCDKSLLGSL